MTTTPHRPHTIACLCTGNHQRKLKVHKHQTVCVPPPELWPIHKLMLPLSHSASALLTHPSVHCANSFVSFALPTEPIRAPLTCIAQQDAAIVDRHPPSTHTHCGPYCRSPYCRMFNPPALSIAPPNVAGSFMQPHHAPAWAWAATATSVLLVTSACSSPDP